MTELARFRHRRPRQDDVGDVVAHRASGSTDAFRLYEAGRQYERQARSGEAEDAYRRALKLDPALHAAWVANFQTIR